MRSPATAKDDRTAGLTPNVPCRVIQVAALSGYRLRIGFVDGIDGEGDMPGLVNKAQADVMENPGVSSLSGG